MTIKPGQPWGEPASVLPADAVEVHTDREISLALDAARRANQPFPVFVIRGGDLYRTFGGTGATTFPLDVGEVLVDGRHHFFAAHVELEVRGRRHFVAVMNAQWMGDWNVGPKAHPNDGVLDVTEFKLKRFEWRQVKARLPTGTHVPHPRIETHRTKAMTFEFGEPAGVVIDNDEVDFAEDFAFRVLPDAITVIA